MKVIEINIVNTYTCQVCKKEFDTNYEYLIILNQSPLCSSKCVFRLYYKKLSAYDKKDLLLLGELLKIQDFNIIKQQTLIFELNKRYPKCSLSSINKNTQYSYSRKHTQKTEHNLYSYSTNPLIGDLSINAEHKLK